MHESFNTYTKSMGVKDYGKYIQRDMLVVIDRE